MASTSTDLHSVKLVSCEVRTGITETGFEVVFIDLLRFSGRSGFSPCNENIIKCYIGTTL